MELRQLRIFRELARHLNFTRTAATLSYAQSNVTTQIQSLEAELGTPLFERLGKRVSLTDTGRRFLPYAEEMLRLAEEARSAVALGGEASGLLTIGAAETVLAYRLPPLIHRFQERYPKVELSFHPGTCDRLRELLADGTVDVAFLLEEHSHPGNLTLEPLVHEELVLVAAPGHRLAAASPHSLVALQGEPLLLTQQGCSYRVQIERALSDAQVTPGAVMTFANLEAIKQCASMGMGIALLPAIAVRAELASGHLAQIHLDRPPLGVVTFVAWHKDKWLSPALRSFLNVVRESPPLMPSEP